MAEPRFPARLHVVLARDASVGVVIRRGPSKAVLTLLWDRRRDTFEPGQWLRGRIYERRSDLSPDGKHFLYFAMNGHWGSETKGAWTAISRAPYLKAVALYAKGDCWHGGGLFFSERDFWLNDGFGHEDLRSSKSLRRSSRRPAAYYGGECPTVYFNRLQRDGWTLKSEKPLGTVVFEKTLTKGWILRKFAFAETGAPPGRGCYWDAHELARAEIGASLSFPEWEWAEWVDGRLVFATEGKLFTAGLAARGLTREKLLADFNEMKFERRVAPY